MKLKKTLSLVFSVLMIATLVGCAFISSAEETAPVSDTKPIITDPIAVLAPFGKETGDVPTGHGQNQTRMVTVSTGTYIGVMNGYQTTVDDAGVTYPFSIIRINPDGTSQLIFDDFAHNGGGTVTMMADKNENVWVYTGWGTQSGKAYFNVWRIDTKTDEVTLFQSVQKTKGTGGKMVAFIDPEYNHIYAVHSASPFFGWCAFDIGTETWEKALYVKVGNGVCYHFAYGDGKGGFYCVHERDDANDNVFCNIEGMRVSEAMKTYRSRSINAGYMWDEGLLYYVPNAEVNELISTPLTECIYDVENGCYPNWTNASNDLFYDYSTGLMYAGINYLDNGVPGNKNHVFVIDINHDREVISDQMLPFLYGDDFAYNHRFYQDLEGNLWLMITNQRDGYIEIWKGEGELKKDFRLVYNEMLPGNFSTVYNVICSTNRSGSIPSDIAHIMIQQNSDWYYMEIDFAALREMAK